MTTNTKLWQTKVAARLHDPAEKALVLMRDPRGHENGTSLAMSRLLNFVPYDPNTADPDNSEALSRTVFKHSMPKDMYQRVQHADWWAAAADRPQFPLEEIPVEKRNGDKIKLQVSSWAQVSWIKEPVLIHPLTGDELDLKSLRENDEDTDVGNLKQISFDQLSRLLVAKDDHPNDHYDWQKTLLSLWRFAPEMDDTIDVGRWGALWGQLPADTRIPEHSIWDHLDLTSAFAGAFTADTNGEVALLSLALGPVQPFIAAARKMDDLWAGSHLLARLSWEAMRVVCEALGPDAILFPRLRGVPQVDLWLRDCMHLPEHLFDNCSWKKTQTDANPLFSAALPNRFVAIVPANQVTELVESIKRQVRLYLNELGESVVRDILHEAGLTETPDETPEPFAQMQDQLEGFPDIHWAAIPFSLIQTDAKQKVTSTVALSDSMQPFFADDKAPGFLGSAAWGLFKKGIEVNTDGSQYTFFTPNPGVLYPAVHDLAERVLAAAKTNRAFKQLPQYGYRDSLSGENEWLTTDRTQLQFSPRQQQGTLWAKLAAKKPSLAKKGEHLGGLSAIKRLWPSIFAREIGLALQGDIQAAPDRFVVSTHTMSLAHQLDQYMRHPKSSAQLKALEKLKPKLENQPPAALPRKLATSGYFNDPDKIIARIPSWLDQQTDLDENNGTEKAEKARKLLGDLLGSKPETYYALIKMDGDRMGAWLAGGDDYAITYHESFHPSVQAKLQNKYAKNAQLNKYGKQKRALSPNRHLAISGALNDFSLYVVRHIVEKEFLGRLIYAGGDDVFAMLPVADVLPAMERLRNAYSGVMPKDQHMDWDSIKKHSKKLHGKKGFVWLEGKLMRMMGSRATASCGAVIAHHQAPLSAVRRELDAAETRAKNAGGRDAFSITIVKRSGGALELTDKWGKPADKSGTPTPVKLLCDFRDFLVNEDVSRRAVYHILEWLDAYQLPESALQNGMAEELIAYQLWRQAGNKDVHKVFAFALAKNLLELVPAWRKQAEVNHQTLNYQDIIDKLRNFLQVAEFLARETRSAGVTHSAQKINHPESDGEDQP